MAGPEHTTPEMLIRDADFAMYRAKQEGGGRFEIFDKHLEVHVSTDQQERERELRRVLDKRQFEVWYQPIYRLQSGKLEGFESLLALAPADGSVDSFRVCFRWPKTPASPSRLGRETVETVCRQLRAGQRHCRRIELTLTSM
jgi:predicted signal transduction protein with EAL and GGDEF domain